MNHLIDMDDIKPFAENEKELEALIKKMWEYTGMEFGREKCAMLVIKSGERHMTEGAEVANQAVIRTLGENETYKYLGILEAHTIKQVEMNRKNKIEYLKRTRKLLEI